MYSKNKGFNYQQTVLTPPPGYDGSRFRGRSDGRDDSFPLYENQARTPRRILTKKTPDVSNDEPYVAEEETYGDTTCEQEEGAEQSASHHVSSGDVSPISLLAPILKRIGKEELIIIALIIILAGERDGLDTDTILLLALLLCAG